MEREVFVLRLNGHAGDAVMARPVLSAFRSAHPAARIHLEAPEAHHPLLRDLRDVDFLRPLGGARSVAKPLVLCDFGSRPWARSRTHVMDAMAASLGVPVRDRAYALALPADAERWADGEASRLGRFAAVHVRSSLESKDWPAERFSELAVRLRESQGLAVAQVGGNGDPALGAAGREDYRGRLSWLETAALLSRASLFVGPDSVCMHLSRAVREVPAVVPWGATSPLTSGLFGGAVANLEPSRWCGHAGRPCHDRCDWTSRCVDSVIVDDAADAAGRLLAPPGTGPSMTVVLVNWNSFVQYTRRMVHKLDRTMRSDDWELVLVDNGSEGDREALAAFRHPRLAAKVLLPENRGLPAAWNEACRRAKGRVIALLNTDVEIEEDGWDLRVSEFLRAHPAAAALGVSLNEPPMMFGHNWAREALPLEPGRGTRCHHVNGSALFIPRRAFDRVGGFDERYGPGYCEETDWCMRANLALEEIWHLCAAFRHEGHGVTRRVNKMDLQPVIARNNAYFAGKWDGCQPPWPGVPASGVGREPAAAFKEA